MYGSSPQPPHPPLPTAPAPPYYAPPGPGYPMGPPPMRPVYIAGPPQPAGLPTREAIEELRASILYYSIYLALNVLVVIVSVTLLSAATVGGFGGLGGVFGSGGRRTLTPPSGNALPAYVAIGIVGFVSFILLLLAWFKWLNGAKRLEGAAYEYGPGPAEAARRARADWTHSTVVFFVQLIVVVAFVVVVIVSVVQSILPSLNNTTARPTSVTFDFNSLLPAFVGFALVSVLFTFLMYWFATRGLVGSLAALASAELRAEAESARRIILAGAVVAALGIAGYFIQYGSLLALASPLALLLGFWKLGGAYDRWLERPPPPSGAAPYGFPPARPY